LWPFDAPWVNGAVLLILAQAFLVYELKSETKHSLTLEVLTAIIPNLIAALLSSLFLYMFVKDDDRANYVRAMRSLRDAVHGLVKDGKIASDDVQGLMKKFVPAVSNLYFRQAEPKVPPNERNLCYEKEKCFACERPFPVVDGRCNECKDIRASWRAEEKDPAAKVS
jgi:hypothetical protein